MTDNKQDRRTFSKKLLHWYDHSDRRALPWQKNKTAYRVWVSEIMLQQTQASKVIDYFDAFIKRFPSLKKLATAHIDEVLEQWAGLGYYRRAHQLHRSAKIIRDVHRGRLPRKLPGLLALPGIGRSTAGAILALAFNQRYAMLDGNVKRVMARYCDISGWPGHAQVAHQLWQAAEAMLPERRMADYTQAIMELGATVCTPRNAQCMRCPLRSSCRAYRQDIVSHRPAPAANKKEKQVCQLLMLFICCGPRVALEHRPASGIWAGLLCPPQSPSPHHALKKLHQWGIRQAPIPGTTVVHELSHRRLLITPWFVRPSKQPNGRLDSSLNWYKMSQANLAVPAAVTKLLPQLKRQQKEWRNESSR